MEEPGATEPTMLLALVFMLATRLLPVSCPVGRSASVGNRICGSTGWCQTCCMHSCHMASWCEVCCIAGVWANGQVCQRGKQDLRQHRLKLVASSGSRSGLWAGVPAWETDSSAAQAGVSCILWLLTWPMGRCAIVGSRICHRIGWCQACCMHACHMAAVLASGQVCQYGEQNPPQTKACISSLEGCLTCT